MAGVAESRGADGEQAGTVSAAVVERYATRDVELGGAALRRGELVTVLIAGANRDPAAFPVPDRFDVRRENARRHLSFAQGPHVCVGMPRSPRSMIR